MSRKSEIELTNMCLICDGNKVLVQEKAGTNGLVFPGGHVEEGESLLESVVREMKEETGLTIENPKVCGFKDWIQEDGTRYIVLLYKTHKFTGELKSSDEGRVFWIDRADIDSANCKPTHKMKIYDVQNENKHVNNAEYYRINANFNTINSNNYTFIGNIKGYHVI